MCFQAGTVIKVDYGIPRRPRDGASRRLYGAVIAAPDEMSCSVMQPYPPFGLAGCS